MSGLPRKGRDLAGAEPVLRRALAIRGKATRLDSRKGKESLVNDLWWNNWRKS